MHPFCPRCGDPLESSEMKCPRCDSDPRVISGETSIDATRTQGYISFPGPPQMAPNLPPVYYRSGMSGARMSSIAGGVLMLIDGIFALLVGVAGLATARSLVQGVTALILLSAFVLSLLGAVAVFSCWNLHRVRRGVANLVLGGILISFYSFPALVVGAIGIVLALVSFWGIRIGWNEMRMREEFLRHPQQIAVHGPSVYRPYPPPPNGEPSDPDLPGGHW